MHQIRSQTFEIRFSSQEKAYELQTRFTELMHEALLEVMDEVFTQVSLPDVIIRLDKLNLDLGEVDFNTFEHSLPDLLRNKLVDALMAAISEIRYFPKENNLLVAREKANLEVLIYFLRSGTLPWWSVHSKQADFSLSGLLEETIFSQPDMLAASINKEAQAPEIRIRLVRQFTEEVLLKLLAVFVPARLPFIKTFLAELMHVQQEKKLFALTPSTFREILWDFVLSFILVQKQISFEEKVMAEQLFISICRQQNITLSKVLMQLSGVSTFHPAALPSSVERLAKRILAEKRVSTRDFSVFWQQRNAKTNNSEHFSALIQSVVPAHASYVERTTRLLIHVFQQASIGSVYSQDRISTILKEAVIQYLFAAQQTSFDEKEFLKTSLQYIVNKLSVREDLVFRYIAQAGNQAQKIAEIYREILQKKHQTNPTQSSQHALYENKEVYAQLLLAGVVRPSSHYSNLDIIRFFLQFGVLPWTESLRALPNPIDAIIQEFIATQPDSFRQWITASGLIANPTVVQRIRTQFSPAIAQWILEGIAPATTAGNITLTSGEITANADVIIHYLTAYLKTEYLLPELTMSVSELIDSFITQYPETCLGFIATLQPNEQHILLDNSPELVTFMASIENDQAISVLPDEQLMAQAADPEGIPAYKPVNVKEEGLETGKKGGPDAIVNSDDESGIQDNSADDSSVAFSAETAYTTQELVLPENNMLFSDANEFTAEGNSTEIQKEDTPVDKSSITSENVSLIESKEESIPIQDQDKKGNESLYYTAPDVNSLNQQVKSGNDSKVTNTTEDIRQEKKSPEKEESAGQTSLQSSEKKEKLSLNKEAGKEQTHTGSSASKENESIAFLTDEKNVPASKDKATESEKKADDREERNQSNKILPGNGQHDKKQGSGGKPYIWRQPVEPLYIRNAGLVLIHPFLSRLFTMLKLTANKKFIDEQAAQRGVHILHYITHKSEQAPEYELALNKIICGLPVAMPLEREIELTEEEKETCESLVTGVIQNWPILKNTSPDNFRVSFLHREGKLVHTPEDWQLKVENRGYDILIDKLPWAFSMIKLPWMEKVLRVEWR